MSGQQKRRFDDDGSAAAHVPQPPAKRFQPQPGPGTLAGQLNQQNIQAMLENTKKQIAMRKAALLSGGAKPVIPTAQYGVPPPPGHGLMMAPPLLPGQMPIGIGPPQGLPPPQQLHQQHQQQQLPPPTQPTQGLAPNLSSLQASVAARLAAMRQGLPPRPVGVGAMVGAMPPPPPPTQQQQFQQQQKFQHQQQYQQQQQEQFEQQEQIANQPSKPRAPVHRPQSLVLIDGQAKFVDSSGKEMEMSKRASEFSANREGEATEENDEVSEDPRYFDDRVSQKAPTERKKRSGFAFHNQGDFIALASKKRAQAQLEKLQEEIAKASKKTGISSATKLALIAPFKNHTEDLLVPDVEWWDLPLLQGHGKPSYALLDQEGVEADKIFSGISHLIQHPIPVEPPTDGNVAPPIKIMLTKKERKKIRSQRRKAEEKEKQEQIRLGMMEAPAPKVTKKNFMSVLTSDAVADPTKVEAVVAKQIALRQRKHEGSNDSRALTKEQKSEKLVAKHKEASATANSIRVAVFRVNDLSSGQHKYKVNQNATQSYLTGVCLMSKPEANLINLVVVEGGPKGIKHYKKLMMNRIKWSNDDEDSDSDEDEDGPKKVRNKCVLVWEGTAEKRAFQTFEPKMARSEEWARELFNKHGVPQYWDMAYSDAVVEQIQ